MISYTTGTTVRLLDADTLSEVQALDWNIGKPRAVAFNPDGLRAAVSGEGGAGGSRCSIWNDPRPECKCWRLPRLIDQATCRRIDYV